jgi:hypothetical protein
VSTEVRRVITGETPDGKGIFRTVEAVEPIVSHLDFYALWGWNEWPRLPLADGAQFVPESSFPAPEETGGVRISMVSFPPQSDPRSRPRTDDRMANLLRTGRMRERDITTGMHRTDSVEVAFVISGEICLEQDDGAEVRLTRGDCLVQNGARHAWKNRSEHPALLGFVTFAAEREGE